MFLQGAAQFCGELLPQCTAVHREPVSWVVRLATEEIPVHSSSTTAPAPPMLFSIWPPWPSINANAYLLYAFWAEHALAYWTVDHLWYFELVATHATACTSLPFGLFWAEFEYKVNSVAQNVYFVHWEYIEYKQSLRIIDREYYGLHCYYLFSVEIFWQIDQSLLGFSQSKIISRWWLVAGTLY